MSRKTTVIKYKNQIEGLCRKTRRWITDLDRSPEIDALLKHIEDIFFEDKMFQNIDTEDVKIIIDSVFRRTVSKYGILIDLLNDDDVNEIMVNGPTTIYVEKCRRVIPIDDAFTSEEELEEVIRMFAADVHREINEANPIVDARLPNGYRVNGVLKNVALNGPILTIRKFSEHDIDMEDLIRYGTISKECADDLNALVNSGYNVFISGGTSSGKTTFLNALATSINKNERVIIIEDSSELKINNLNNKVHMECRIANSIGKGEVSMEQLIRTSLRMRPDRIIVGEVRGREVVDMIQALNTGHEGGMSTGHGNSIRGMLNRLETMYMMDTQIPIYSIKNQIANAIDIFVHLRRDSDGKRKVVEVAELVGFDGNEYILNYLYKTGSNGELKRTENWLKDRNRLERNGKRNILVPKEND